MTPYTFRFDTMYDLVTELGREQLHLRKFVSQKPASDPMYDAKTLALQYEDSYRCAQELGADIWAAANLLKGDKGLSRDQVCDLPQGERHRIRLLMGQLQVLTEICQEIWKDIQALSGGSREAARIVQQIHDTAADNVRLLLEVQDALEQMEQARRDDSWRSRWPDPEDIDPEPLIPDDWTLMAPAQRE